MRKEQPFHSRAYPRVLVAVVCMALCSACQKEIRVETSQPVESRDPLETVEEIGEESTSMETFESIYENSQEDMEEFAHPLQQFFQEAEEGKSYLEKLGFSPTWTNDVLLCLVPNGVIAFCGYASDFPSWMGEIYLENAQVSLIYSNDLVYFWSEEGEKFQLSSEGFLYLEG